MSGFPMSQQENSALNRRSILTWTAPISLLAVSSALVVGLLSFGAGGLERTRLLWRFEFSLIVALWVRFDRPYTGFGAPFEFDAFMFFGWPLLLPFYLYRTRRWWGLMLAVGVYLLSLVPSAITGLVGKIP